MADIEEEITLGESRPLFGSATLAGGTLTIQSGATVTLTDAWGQVAGSISGAAVTGYDSSAAETVRAWYQLDPSALSLSPGTYTLAFTFSAVRNDGAPQSTFRPTVEVTVLDPAGVADGPDYSRFPSGFDLKRYLRSLNCIPAESLEAALAGMRCGAKVAAAQKLFERQTGWQPFLADPADVTRSFDPPGTQGGPWTSGGERALFLNAGLLAVTSLKTNVSTTYAGDLLTIDEDYWLEPTEAAIVGTPYTEVRFVSRQWGGPHSIQITGRWGYASTLPEDAWDAILKKAASLCVPELTLQISRGIVSFTDMKTQVVYSNSTAKPFQFEQQSWEAAWDLATLMYRRVSL